MRHLKQIVSKLAYFLIKSRQYFDKSSQYCKFRCFSFTFSISLSIISGSITLEAFNKSLKIKIRIIEFKFYLI